MLKYFALILFCIFYQSDAEEISNINHPVSTTNPQAQDYFNKGLTQIFAFNHDLAFKEFQNAIKIDPELAMAYWGMALALGQNINQDITPENEIKAYEFSRKALSLISHATPVEQAYIKALSVRYTNNPNQNLVALRFLYRDAMDKLTKMYPEDLDAGCLYAESILNLNPWKYWTWDGKPYEGTLKVIDILQSILNRNPKHMGANHFYIHAWEESLTPERALLSAFRLTTLFKSGHLLHMPCHIFMLCGYYENAIETSKKAIAADQEYIKEYGMGGNYPLHYLTHNYKVLVRAYMFSEDYPNTVKTLEELNHFVAPHFQHDAHLANVTIVPFEANLYFHQWQNILNLQEPELNNSFVIAYWHFSRAMAQLNLNRIEEYQKEKRLMIKFKDKIGSQDGIANNPASKVIELAQLILSAEESKYQNHFDDQIEKLRIAVDMQDRMDYDEPPPWYLPLRIPLGKALLARKRYDEAEAVFKKGLVEYQRHGRLLQGLYESLKAQGKDWDAMWIEQEIKSRDRGETSNLFHQ